VSSVVCFGAADEVDDAAAAVRPDRHLEPAGNTSKAADFLAGVLQREGIAVTRYEPEPGKAIVLARLKATVSPPAGKAVLLLHHMDVVPADRSQWKTDPFSGTIQGPTSGAAARST
jgi:acetylornithine deacetylase/succinyl-diaminopimelate desuccinylase-like protein